MLPGLDPLTSWLMVVVVVAAAIAIGTAFVHDLGKAFDEADEESRAALLDQLDDPDLSQLERVRINRRLGDLQRLRPELELPLRETGS